MARTFRAIGATTKAVDGKFSSRQSDDSTLTFANKAQGILKATSFSATMQLTRCWSPLQILALKVSVLKSARKLKIGTNKTKEPQYRSQDLV